VNNGEDDSAGTCTMTINVASVPDATGAVVTTAAPKELVLTFDEAVDSGSLPGTGAFDVKINGGNRLDLSSVHLDNTDATSATRLKLGLPHALTAVDMNVTIDYAMPGDRHSRLQNAVGKEVGLSA